MRHSLTTAQSVQMVKQHQRFLTALCLYLSIRNYNLLKINKTDKIWCKIKLIFSKYYRMLVPLGLLIEDAKRLSHNFGELCYSHTKRECNTLAHNLARYALSISDFFSMDGRSSITVSKCTSSRLCRLISIK